MGLSLWLERSDETVQMGILAPDVVLQLSEELTVRLRHRLEREFGVDLARGQCTDPALDLRRAVAEEVARALRDN